MLSACCGDVMRTTNTAMTGLLLLGLLWSQEVRAFEGSTPGLVLRIILPLGPDTRVELKREARREKATYLLDVQSPPSNFFLRLREQQSEPLLKTRLLRRQENHLRILLTLSRPEYMVVTRTLVRPRRQLIEIGDRFLLAGGVGDDRIPFAPFPLFPGEILPILPRVAQLPISESTPEGRALLAARRLHGQGQLGGALQILKTISDREGTTRLGLEALYLEGIVLADLMLSESGFDIDQEAPVRGLTRAIYTEPKHPLAPIAQYLLARVYRKLERPQEALDVFLRCMEQRTASPFGGICRISAADLRFREQRLDAVEALLSPYPTLDESEDLAPGEEDEMVAYAAMLRGLMAYKLGKMDIARQTLGRLLAIAARIGRRHPELYFLLAESLLAMGEDEPGRQIYRQLASWRPKLRFIALVQMRLGDLLLWEGSKKKATDQWVESGYRYRGTLGGILSRMRVDAARVGEQEYWSFLNELWSGSASHPYLAQEAGVRLARAAWRRNLFDKARSLLAELDHTAPDHPYRKGLGWLWNRMAYLSYAAPSTQKRYLDVANRFRRDGGKLQGRLGEIGLMMMVSEAFMELGLYEDAALLIQSGLPTLEKEPEEQLMLRRLARIFILLERKYQAGKVLQYLETRLPRPEERRSVLEIKADLAALRKDAAAEEARLRRYFATGGRSPQRRARLGQLLLNRGALKPALKALRLALATAAAQGSASGKDLPIWVARARMDEGEVLMGIERHREAGLAFEKAAELFAEREEAVWASYRQGEALFKGGRVEEAQVVWKRASERPGFWGELAARAARDFVWQKEQASSFRSALEQN